LITWTLSTLTFSIIKRVASIQQKVGKKSGKLKKYFQTPKSLHITVLVTAIDESNAEEFVILFDLSNQLLLVQLKRWKWQFASSKKHILTTANASNWHSKASNHLENECLLEPLKTITSLAN
jgi:hypothetical protein